MELTTVSPSAISPTEGDDLCEIDVPNVAIHSVTLLIGLCGLAGNGAVLWLLRLKFTNVIIFDLAVADFLVLLFTVPSILIFLLEDVSCTPIMPLMYVRFLFQLSALSYYWGLFRLTSISIVSDMDKLWQLCCHCHVPVHLWSLVWRAQYWAFFAVIAVIPTVTFLCPSNEQELCRVSLISVYAIILLLFAAPIIFSCTIDFIKAKHSSQRLKPKRRNIVIFLILLFTLLLILWNFLQQLGYIVVPSHIVFLLSCINGSIKPCIYILAGISWRHCSLGRPWRHCTVGSLRDSLQRVFEEEKDDTAHRNDAARDTMISVC